MRITARTVCKGLVLTAAMVAIGGCGSNSASAGDAGSDGQASHPDATSMDGQTPHPDAASKDSATQKDTGTTDQSVPSSRVVWVPDYYGQVVHVFLGGGTSPITLNLPATCTPNSVAVNSGNLYVACSLGTGASGSTADQILVYGASAIAAASPGTTLMTAPSQTITSGSFDVLLGIAFDASNDLWIASYMNDDILEIAASELSATTPTVTVSLTMSPNTPTALAFDPDGSLWVTGQNAGYLVLNFLPSQFGLGDGASPRYCISSVGSDCLAPQTETAPFLTAEGLALFSGDIFVANNSTGSTGATPGREIFDLRVTTAVTSGVGAISLINTYGSSTNASLSPVVCPGGLFSTGAHLWVNDESYGETSPACGAAGDVSGAAGGIFSFTEAELSTASLPKQVPVYTNVTGRPGFGGLFVQND
jgi:hypothetical protein